MANQFVWNGAAVQSVVTNAIMEAVESARDELLRKANETIPIDTGMMLQSGQVDVDRDRLHAEISYSTPYVIRQHEDTTLRHTNGRRARWLELTAIEEAPRLGQWVARQVKVAFGGIG